MKQGAPKWRCGVRKSRTASACSNAPGWGTNHPNWGACKKHTTRDQDWMWMMALNVSSEENISPWDALLKAVRKAAGRVAWIDEQLADATRRHDGDMMAGEVRYWLKESRNERNMMARMSKAAIDAGVAERMVRQVELEGQLVADALVAGLDALELTPEQRTAAIEKAHQRLLSGESNQTATIQGTVLYDESGTSRPTGSSETAATGEPSESQDQQDAVDNERNEDDD